MPADTAVEIEFIGGPLDGDHVEQAEPPASVVTMFGPVASRRADGGAVVDMNKTLLLARGDRVHLYMLVVDEDAVPRYVYEGSTAA